MFHDTVSLMQIVSVALIVMAPFSGGGDCDGVRNLRTGSAPLRRNRFRPSATK